MAYGDDGSQVPKTDYSYSSTNSNWSGDLMQGMSRGGSSGGGKGGYSDSSSGDQYVNSRTGDGKNDQGGKNLTSGRASGGLFGLSGAVDHSQNYKNILDNAFNQSFGANWSVNFSGTQVNKNSQDFPYSNNEPVSGNGGGAPSASKINPMFLLIGAGLIVGLIWLKKRKKK